MHKCVYTFFNLLFILKKLKKLNIKNVFCSTSSHSNTNVNDNTTVATKKKKNTDYPRPSAE